ncbi:unnamed protein product, partial [Protopolystoma xenopodis]
MVLRMARLTDDAVETSGKEPRPQSNFAVEFFAEWSLWPENEVYRRIHAGTYLPHAIGDKARWFAHHLDAVLHFVWPSDHLVLLPPTPPLLLPETSGIFHSNQAKDDV